MINPNAPAFPNGPIHMGNQEGLTKREYLAAMAMRGLVRYPNLVNDPVLPRVAVELAVRFADALILELNKQEN